METDVEISNVLVNKRGVKVVCRADGQWPAEVPPTAQLRRLVHTAYETQKLNEFVMAA